MMQHFVVCDHTGKILRAGTCQQVDLLAQVMNADELILTIGESVDPNKWRINVRAKRLVPVR